MRSSNPIISSSSIWLHLPDRSILIPLTEFAARENVQLYLVGGTVRDIILGKEVDDLDFAVAGNALDFARKFADSVNVSFVPLDEEHDTARVAFRKNGLHMDFCGIRGADIAEDLSARDFTINAMAIDLNQMMNADEVQVIDPHGGALDLDDNLVRAVSEKSIEDDPIRMLRAYRFTANLDFTVDNKTSEIIQNSVRLLDSVSVERIRDEFLKMLSACNSAHHLRAMDSVGLLEQMFPEIIRMRGMEQNDYHHLDVWEHSMLTLEFLEKNPMPDSVEKYRPEIENYLKYELVKSRPRGSLLKLAALLHDVGKPAKRTIDNNGRIRFFDHNAEGSEIIVNIGKRLKLANRETAFLRMVVKDHMYPLGLSVFLRRSKGIKGKQRAMRRFIHRTGGEWLAILLLSFADLRATQGPRRKTEDLGKLVRLIGDIASMYFQKNRSPMPIITGRDLMKELELPSGPTIGKLLRQVEEAQLNGIVKTRDDAMELVRNILSRY